jgi:hypothetical protein
MGGKRSAAFILCARGSRFRHILAEKELKNMAVVEYRRLDAVRYAAAWALSRNPVYPDFTDMGGDCANFISQCLRAGGAPMNYTKDIGWYYRSMNDRAPAWSGAVFLHRFLTRTQGEGIFARQIQRTEQLEKGDLIFLTSGGSIYHSLLVLQAKADPLVAAHTADSLMRPLSDYENAGRLLMHIEGIRL